MDISLLMKSIWFFSRLLKSKHVRSSLSVDIFFVLFPFPVLPFQKIYYHFGISDQTSPVVSSNFTTKHFVLGMCVCVSGSSVLSPSFNSFCVWILYHFNISCVHYLSHTALTDRSLFIYYHPMSRGECTQAMILNKNPNSHRRRRKNEEYKKKKMLHDKSDELTRERLSHYWDGKWQWNENKRVPHEKFARKFIVRHIYMLFSSSSSFTFIHIAVAVVAVALSLFRLPFHSLPWAW